MKNKKIELFHPFVPETVVEEFRKIIIDEKSKWVGQGWRVDKFEKIWEDQISTPHKAIAVGSGTDAMHLAYILAGIKEGDEVITPVFTCTASHMGILYQKAKPIFADCKKDNLNVDPKSVEKLVTEKTKAIVCVDYSGLPADLDELQTIANKWNIPLIEDACQAHGSLYKGRHVGSISDYTAFSFQGIKLIVAPDSGMLTIKNPELEDKAKRIRWFGIDRKAKLEDRWKNDIYEVGYKYQMTDISAMMAMEAMKIFDKILEHQRKLFVTYRQELYGIPGIEFIDEDDDRRSSCWIATVLADKREDLKKKLAENGIESNQVHYRTDQYSVFGGRVNNCPNMDELENKYLVLPMHHYVTVEDVKRICEVIRGGWG